eukprot:scaffold30294_cov51-Isochrysis_galbana.AAC.1
MRAGEEGRVRHGERGQQPCHHRGGPERRPPAGRARGEPEWGAEQPSRGAGARLIGPNHLGRQGRRVPVRHLAVTRASAQQGGRDGAQQWV